MHFFPKKFYQKSLFIFFSLLILLSSNTFAKVAPHHSDVALKKETQDNIANDDVRGEDLNIRQAAVEALGNRAGTIVIMHAQTGRIYSIVNQKWAIQDGFKPCSTIKLVTGVAGYKENLIQNNGNLARGSYKIGLDMSLAYSNNDFFQLVGKNLGSEKMISYARELGLGERTGINADNEFEGKLPYGNENLRIYSHADDFLATPLQLSVMVSAITNGGKVLVPRIPRSNQEKARFNGYFRDNLNLDANIYERVIPGMMGAVKYGTAGRIKNANLNIAGKTGSCISRKTWVGLFVSVAPIQNPKFSVVVILRGKYARGKYSAAIAEKIYQSLRPRYNENFNRNLARKTITIQSSPKTADETIAKKETPSESNNVIVAKTISKRNPTPIKNTVITYKLNPDSENENNNTNETKKKPAPVKKEKPKVLFPTVIINGKTEITRPRIVKNR